jgi:hypothetical protein
MAFNETAFRRRGPLLELTGRGVAAQAELEFLDLCLSEALPPQ